MTNSVLAHHWLPVDRALRDPTVTNISIYRHDRVIAEHSDGRRERLQGWSESRHWLDALMHLAVRVDRPLSEERPILDASWPEEDGWPGGARINCSIPPLARFPQATIRVPRSIATSLDVLTDKMFPKAALFTLRHILDARLNFVLTGLPGSGKTYLMRAMLSEVAHERLYIIEDTAELQLECDFAVEHCLGNSAVRVAASDSIRAALRTRIDRIILGELRDPDAVLNWLEAAEAGFDGCCATTHSTVGEGVILRLAGLVRRATKLDPEAARELVVANLHATIHVANVDGHGHRVVRIDRIEKNGVVTPLWRWQNDELRPNPKALDQFLSPRDRY